MKWQGRRQSSNVTDRRGAGGRGVGGRGAAIGGVGGLGALAIVVIGYFLGVDVTPFLEGGGSAQQSAPRTLSAEEKAAGEFASVTLADTEEIWADIFRTQLSASYSAPKMVLFSGATNSACGGASAATGPFYCPSDQSVYLDTDFFVTMERQLGAGGDFAFAYVIAHEVGHHVQNLLGVLSQTNQIRAQSNEVQANRISVMVELQADCFAGIWARYAAEKLGTLEEGDVAEAMNAAQQIGDDTLQSRAGQRVRPESFTHGSSAERERWFMQGYRTGAIDQCNTFS